MKNFAVDTETALIAPGALAPEMACLSWANDLLGAGIRHANQDPEWIADFLTTADRIVGANFAYDAAVLIAKFPQLMRLIFDLYRDGKIEDIQLNEMLIDIGRGELGGAWVDGKFQKRYYSLDALHQKYGFPALDKNTWRLRYGELIDVPLHDWDQGARDYPQEDGRATMRVDIEQVEFSEFTGNGPDQAAAAFALHLMSCRGLRTDPVAVAKLRKKQEDEIEAARKVAEKAGLVTAAGKKCMKVARERLRLACEKAGIAPPTTEKGNISVDSEACDASGDPALQAFSLYGSANTLLKKVETLEKGVHTPLQTRYDVLKETGRTSSRAPGAPLIGDNFQNPPRAGGYRECIIPRPGYVFCSVDYDGAELHTLAQVCLWAVGHSRLAEVLNAGRDPHLALGAEYLLAEGSISYEEAVRRKGDPLVKAARQTAKIPNFGLPGGLGAKTLAEYAKQYGVTMTLEEAKAIKAAWLEMWPEMPDYFAWINGQMVDGEATIKQFVSGRIRGRCSYTQACNSYFQGLAADAAKSALLPLARECYLEEDSPLYGSYPVLFIHDEVIAELPEETAHLAGPRMAEIMVDCFNKYVPDCKVTASPALMRRWYKGAEAVYDASGKLIPWEPQEKRAA